MKKIILWPIEKVSTTSVGTIVIYAVLKENPRYQTDMIHITIFDEYFLKQCKPLALFFLLFFLQVQSQTLLEYKEEALQNNPELKVVQNQYKTAVEQINEVENLSNTMIGAGYFVSEPEIITGIPKVSFHAQQRFPWFGTKKILRDNAKAHGEVYKNNIEIKRSKIFRYLEESYYTLYGLKAKISVLKAQGELMEAYKRSALDRFSDHKILPVDLLKLNTTINNLQNQLEILKGNVLTEETVMNHLLHRDGFDTLKIPNNLYIPDEEPTLMMDDIIYHPELETFDYLDAAVDQKVMVNKKEGFPSVGIGLEYIIVEKRSEVGTPNNGKDIVMPTVSLSVPLFTSKYKSRNIQYDLEKKGLLLQREVAQNNLENMLEAAVNKRITARINYDTQQKNIEQAKETENQLQKETENKDLEQLLEVQQMLLDFEYKKIEAIETYFKQTAILNYLR